MAFTKIAAAGIGSTGTVTLENLVVTGSITASLTGTATTTTNIPNLTGAITSNNTTTSLGSFSSDNLATALSDKTGSGSNVFATSPTLTTVTVSSGGINVTGVSTLGNTVIGGGTTQLVVTGNARITGILTIGTSSITLDGSNNQLNVGTGVTLHHTNGVQVGGNTLHSTGLTLNSLTATGVSTFTNGPILVGTATSTGTASQKLQVDGGAYVSGNLGIGTTNPTSKLQVVGSTDLNKLNLSGISSSISSTAVDVFVYDTRKDSDGGAWRKRTQHTSWYNETLNTATRGSRKDFPAVAVIVATTTTVTIYDGDDPDMPMWMVFTFGMIRSGTQSTNVLSAVSMLNGILFTAVGSDSNNNPYSSRIDFLKEECKIWGNARYYVLGGIVSRNSGYTFVEITSFDNIVNLYVNDVAMTVLPNAPIDAATGLPVPTIAVATNGGVSVIKDDGSVVNITCNNGSYTTSRKVTFLDDNALGLSLENSNAASEDSFYIFNIIPAVSTIITVDTKTGSPISANALYSVQYAPQVGAVGVDLHILGSNSLNRTITRANRLNFANTYGLSTIAENRSSPNNGMVAYATTSYSSGWMHGDIKGTFLSDTSTASVTGTELITNGTFTTNTTGWSNHPEYTSSVLSIDTNRLKILGGAAQQSFSTVIGKTYVVVYTLTAFNPGGIYLGTAATGTAAYSYFSTGSQATGTYVYYFTAVSTTTYITLFAWNAGTEYAFYDDVSVRLTELDRSVNAKGLAVYGTITKTAVATGSNLVAYGGFSVSNYLVQPYNSALDFGTGDFCYMCWVKDDSVSAGAVIFQRGAAVNSNETVFYITGDYRLIGRVQTLSNTITTNICFVESAWNHCVFLRKNGIIQIYHNGILQGYATNTETMDQSGYELSIGSWRTNNNYFPTSISLFRVSASVPSPTQIAKIYNDEKMLFQENSQATLYGASDAVTALAYDDTTKLLSVGTSSGRSDFQGLRRINNTTTAVTTAISASNGLIAEQ